MILYMCDRFPSLVILVINLFFGNWLKLLIDFLNSHNTRLGLNTIYFNLFSLVALNIFFIIILKEIFPNKYMDWESQLLLLLFNNLIFEREGIWTLDIFVGNTKKYQLSYNIFDLELLNYGVVFIDDCILKSMKNLWVLSMLFLVVIILQLPYMWYCLIVVTFYLMI